MCARGHERIRDIRTRNGKAICGDVLADRLELDAMGGYAKEWSINGEQVELGVEVTG